MTNLEKYEQAFCKSLELTKDQLAGLEYQKVTSWDSVGHMRLVAAIEDSFDIMMDTYDIIGLSSFEKGKEILAANYGIEF